MKQRTFGSAMAALAAAACVLWTTVAFATITPIVHYRLGEDDPGATIPNVGNDPTVDSVGTLNLPRVSSPTYSPGTPFNDSTISMYFNGVDDRYSQLAVPTTAIDNFGLEAWVKSDGNTAGNAVVAFNGNSGPGGWGLYRFGPSYGVLYGGAAVFGATPVTTEWTHLAVVRDDGVSTFYVNGQSSATSNAAPNVPTLFNDGGMMIGGNQAIGSPAEWFDGSIDEVRAFTFNPGEFTPSDLLIDPVQVAAYFKMGEDEGGSAGNPGAATLIDSVGGFDMSVAGTPAYSADTPGPGSSLSMDFTNATADDYTRGTPILNTSEDFLIEAWAKPNQSDNGGLTFVAFDGSGSQGLGIMQFGGMWTGLVGGVAFVTGTIPVQTEWTHLALVRNASYNGGQTTLLVNGQISGASGSTNTPAPTASIGGSAANNSESFDGLIDEVYFSTIAPGFAFTTDMLHMNSVLVPEPGSLALLAFGAISLAGLACRRRRD